uniref:MD-2-related lipid-recognition domain-containing protein n=1 Tax=Anopheles stephensi TaxID=30069 RepID=A0A182YPN2_ANOST
MMFTNLYPYALFIITYFLGKQKDGYSIKVNNIENCAGPDGIITLTDDATLTMQDDCSLVLEGCVKVKDFSTAAGTISVSKNGNELFKKPIDLCKAGSKVPFLGDFLPGGVCPQSENELCADPNKKIPLNRFKKMLGIMKGSMAVELNLDHDSGKSCIKIEMEISK